MNPSWLSRRFSKRNAGFSIYGKSLSLNSSPAQYRENLRPGPVVRRINHHRQCRLAHRKSRNAAATMPATLACFKLLFCFPYRLLVALCPLTAKRQVRRHEVAGAVAAPRELTDFPQHGLALRRENASARCSASFVSLLMVA